MTYARPTKSMTMRRPTTQLLMLWMTATTFGRLNTFSTRPKSTFIVAGSDYYMTTSGNRYSDVF